jgi:glyoxylase-like metal-dependent hydrolase (beta-lactamase superfamily II)
MKRPDPGKSETLSDGLRRVLAPNAGPMTHWGTNTFILGEGRVAIVDPGPTDAAHLEALFAATRGETVTHILVTHAHEDHSPLARVLSERTDAPIIGFGPPEAGRSEVMTRLAQAGLAGGGEGVDREFRPHTTLGEGDRVDGDGWQVNVLHTPGHFAGHLAFEFNGHVLSGDHVMDWSSSLISPPDGDLAAFMATSRRLRDLNGHRFHPAHGGAIDDPTERLDWLISRRQGRETAILNTLSAKRQDLATLTRAVYTDIPDAMLAAAERNVFSHLIDLIERKLAVADPELGLHASFRLR